MSLTYVMLQQFNWDFTPDKVTTLMENPVVMVVKQWQARFGPQLGLTFPALQLESQDLIKTEDKSEL